MIDDNVPFYEEILVMKISQSSIIYQLPFEHEVKMSVKISLHIQEIYICMIQHAHSWQYWKDKRKCVWAYSLTTKILAVKAKRKAEDKGFMTTKTLTDS